MTIGGQTNLGIAMLILEDQQGRHEPINLASTIDEAREMAISDSQRRIPDALCIRSRTLHGADLGRIRNAGRKMGWRKGGSVFETVCH